MISFIIFFKNVTVRDNKKFFDFNKSCGQSPTLVRPSPLQLVEKCSDLWVHNNSTP
jgi:hypothetical protein